MMGTDLLGHLRARHVGAVLAPSAALVNCPLFVMVKFADCPVAHRVFDDEVRPAA